MGPQYPRRCQERVDPCASATAHGPSLNQPWGWRGGLDQRRPPHPGPLIPLGKDGILPADSAGGRCAWARPPTARRRRRLLCGDVCSCAEGASLGREISASPWMPPLPASRGGPATEGSDRPAGGSGAGQGRFKVPVSPVVRDTTGGQQHPRRCQERVDCCASAAAVAPSLNQPWVAGLAAGGDRLQVGSTRPWAIRRRAVMLGIKK